MNKYIIITFAIVVIFPFFSCDDNSVGPCEHTYNEAILHISSIRDTLNNIHPRFIKIRDLKINGSSQFGSNPLIVSYSIVADDSVYYCNIPFGFGVQAGSYEFIIEAYCFQPKRFVIENVKYSISKGGCPSYNDGGKRIELIIN